MSEVYAARAVVPHMLERGDDYLLQTASAAGQLFISNPSNAVTMHGSVALTEWLAITYGGKGIKMSCFCPMGVQTDMLRGAVSEADKGALPANASTSGDAAYAVVTGLDEVRFLILTHPDVHGFVQRKVSDDRWVGGIGRYQQNSLPSQFAKDADSRTAYVREKVRQRSRNLHSLGAAAFLPYLEPDQVVDTIPSLHLKESLVMAT